MPIDLDLIPSETRKLMRAFTSYQITTNWTELQLPVPAVEHVTNWGTESWARFLDWMSTHCRRDDLVKSTLMAIKPHVCQTYESMKLFQDYLKRGEDSWQYTVEHLALVTSGENLVDFILFYAWHDERIKPQVITLIKKFWPTPTQWMKGFNGKPFSNLYDELTTQLIAAHWEATDTSFVEWHQAIVALNEANGSELDFNSVVAPEIILLRAIAIDKMRAIVRADCTFKDPVT